MKLIRYSLLASIVVVTAGGAEGGSAQTLSRPTQGTNCLQAVKKDGVKIGIREFLKSCGVPNCPSNISELKARLDRELRTLDAEHQTFRAILRIDPAQIADVKELCHSETISSALMYSTLNNTHSTLLPKIIGELRFLHICSIRQADFIKYATRKSWSASLRDISIRRVKALSERARNAKNKAKFTLARLKNFPKRIGMLKEIRKIACSKAALGQGGAQSLSLTSGTGKKVTLTVLRMAIGQIENYRQHAKEYANDGGYAKALSGAQAKLQKRIDSLRRNGQAQPGTVAELEAVKKTFQGFQKRRQQAHAAAVKKGRELESVKFRLSRGAKAVSAKELTRMLNAVISKLEQNVLQAEIISDGLSRVTDIPAK